MGCCQCSGIESQFDRGAAERRLRAYRRGGPPQSTRILLDALVAEGVRDMTLLDIGGGIGIVLHELLQHGAARATDVDASQAYLDAARAEATRQGHANRSTFKHGDFVALADEIAPAEIVTLDRVICCYHDMPALVGRSSAKATRLYGLVYPRDIWWVRAGVKAENALLWLERTPFRVFAHHSTEVDAIVRRNGLEQRFKRNAGLWQVVVYARQTQTERGTPQPAAQDGERPSAAD
jgi:magnesium-protoporphyrin O-methyltransferase